MLVYSKLKSLGKVVLLTNISKSRWNIVVTPVKRKSKYDIIRPFLPFLIKLIKI